MAQKTERKIDENLSLKRKTEKLALRPFHFDFSSGKKNKFSFLLTTASNGTTSLPEGVKNYCGGRKSISAHKTSKYGIPAKILLHNKFLIFITRNTFWLSYVDGNNIIFPSFPFTAIVSIQPAAFIEFHFSFSLVKCCKFLLSNYVEGIKYRLDEGVYVTEKQYK